MSLYQQAMVSGLGAAQLAITGENASTRAAFNQAYKAAATRSNALKARQTNLRNIAGVRSDKILSNFQAEMNREKTLALNKVSSAFAGVSGTSLGDVSNQTYRNEAFQKANNERKEEQSIQGLLANIYTNTGLFLTVEDYEGSYGEAFVEGVSNVDWGAVISKLEPGDAKKNNEEVINKDYGMYEAETAGLMVS